MVKQAGVAAWLAGIAAIVALTVWSGVGSVGHAVSSVGWGILLVVVVRAVTVLVAGAGWWLLFPPKCARRSAPASGLDLFGERVMSSFPSRQAAAAGGGRAC